MAKQIMIMAVVEDGCGLHNLQELQDLLQETLVFKHDIGVLIVEDIEVTQENYDWKKANGIIDEGELA